VTKEVAGESFAEVEGTAAKIARGVTDGEVSIRTIDIEGSLDTGGLRALADVLDRRGLGDIVGRAGRGWDGRGHLGECGSQARNRCAGGEGSQKNAARVGAKCCGIGTRHHASFTRPGKGPVRLDWTFGALLYSRSAAKLIRCEDQAADDGSIVEILSGSLDEPFASAGSAKG
jgi:hypothetical protein